MLRIAVVTSLVVLSAISILGQEGSLARQPDTLPGARSHVYKSIDGADLRLHVFSPAGGVAEGRAAIVLFFGGGWTSGTVGQFMPQARHLAERGMVAVLPDYRVFGRHGTGAFEAIADAKSAIRWVRAQARELGVDPKRIAGGGGSAGAHIALSAAVLDGFDDGAGDPVSPRPDALVLFNPAVDASPESTSRGRAASVFRSRFGARWRDGSPAHHVRAGLPPTLILHGKADTTVPYAHVERYCAEAKRRGNRCDLVGYAGAPHGFFNPQHAEGRWQRESLDEVDRFLTGLGYLPRPR